MIALIFAQPELLGDFRPSERATAGHLQADLLQTLFLFGLQDRFDLLSRLGHFGKPFLARQIAQLFFQLRDFTFLLFRHVQIFLHSIHLQQRKTSADAAAPHAAESARAAILCLNYRNRQQA